MRGSEVELRVAQPSVPPSTSTHTPTTLLVAQVTLPLAAFAGVAVAASPAATSAAIASPDPIRLLIVDFIINLSVKHLDVIYTKVLHIVAEFPNQRSVIRKVLLLTHIANRATPYAAYERDNHTK